MRVIIADLETFWSQTHSLSKMNPIAYVLHPDTEIQSIAVKEVGKPDTHVYFGEEHIRELCDKTDWSDTMLVGHNMSGFDAMLFAWRLGVRPRLWGCTLAMARPFYMNTVGVSLKKVAEAEGVGVKGSLEATNTKGKRLAEFTPSERAAMREYNKLDTVLCEGVFKNLLRKTPRKELLHIDSTVRMLVEPKFLLDVPLLEQALIEERARKRESLLDLAKALDLDVFASDDEAAAHVQTTLASATKFSALLNTLGVDTPMKPSPSDPEGGKMVPALAKSDEGFIALTEHENPLVASAARARLGVKSTLLETRITSFLEVAAYTGGKMPIAQNYHAAHPGRNGGAFGLNQCNLPRVGGKPTDVLRNSLIAPPGYKVVVADLSGIELRINMFLWKVPYAMRLFAADPEHADLYKHFAATDLYCIPIEQVVKTQRQVGKVSHLGLGYGAGAPTFQKVAKTMGGIDMHLIKEEGDEQLSATEVVEKYRAAHPEVVTGWRNCGTALKAIMAGFETEVDPWGLVRTDGEGFVLPSGRKIRYPNLRYQADEKGKRSLVYGEGRNKAYIHGSKADENCLAEGTLVFTDAGWLPIESISTTNLVHDGDTFVRHGGIVFKSVQPCVSIDGVYMTADHEVLTNEGWKVALARPRPFRPNVRRFDRLKLGGVERAKDVVAFPLSVWGTSSAGRCDRNQGGKARWNPKLWVPNQSAHEFAPVHSRHDKAPRIWRLSKHDRPLSPSVPQSLEKLWRAWNKSVRQMGKFVREFLVGHGPVVPAGIGLGPGGQRRALFSEELPLDHSPYKHYEQTEHNQGGGRPGTEPGNWYRAFDDIQQNKIWLADRTVVGSARCEKPVYDIINAGPQQRFVVLGAGGPLVVHNCVQALARDVLKDNALTISQELGFHAHEVYDELVYILPEDTAEDGLRSMLEVMRTPPVWWPELAVWAEGDIADSYGAAK